MIKSAIEAFSLFVKNLEPNTKYVPGSPLIEFERLPGIVLDGPTIVENRQLDSSRRPEFEKMPDGSYLKLPGPKYYNLDFTVKIISACHEDLIRMTAEWTACVASTVDLEFPADAPKYSCYVRIVGGFTPSAAQDISGICQAQATVRIESVPLLPRIPAQKIPAVQTIDIEIKDEKEGSVMDGTRIK